MINAVANVTRMIPDRAIRGYAAFVSHGIRNACGEEKCSGGTTVRDGRQGGEVK